MFFVVVLYLGLFLNSDEPPRKREKANVEEAKEELPTKVSRKLRHSLVHGLAERQS